MTLMQSFLANIQFPQLTEDQVEMLEIPRTTNEPNFLTLSHPKNSIPSILNCQRQNYFPSLITFFKPLSYPHP